MPPRKSNKPPPAGYEVIEPIIEALENELRDKVKESNAGKRNTESIWPVHQINWQRTRYVYDMYYTYHRISKAVYDYCLKNKIADAMLIAKWKKPGYERLCSTYVINPANYKFGTTSICRVPIKDRGEMQKNAQDPTTGCLGCASGKGAGPRNIFGNKYGQNLAAVQIAREKRMAAMEAKREAERLNEPNENDEENSDNGEEDMKQINHHGDGESETDDDTNDDTDDEDDDYGPSPAAGVWAGSKRLQAESEALANDDSEEAEEDDSERPSKKVKNS
jgi:bud site selection protein 31